MEFFCGHFGFDGNYEHFISVKYIVARSSYVALPRILGGFGLPVDALPRVPVRQKSQEHIQ